MANLG
jgi:hypothetical protein